MNDEPKLPENPALKPAQIGLIVAIVLVGVTLGTLFTLKFDSPRPRNKPTALGHYLSEPRSESPSTNGESAPVQGKP